MALPLTNSDDKSFLIIGPYTEQDFSKRDFSTSIEKYKLPTTMMERLIQHFASVPLITDPAILSAVYHTFAETIWGSSDNYTIKSITHSLPENYISMIPDTVPDFIYDAKEIPMKMKLLESKYNAENDFLRHIAQGNYHKAELAFNSSTLFDLETTIEDPVRNLKNHSIVLNALLRKAAEQGGVHPVHIDRVSTHFKNTIESIASQASGRALMKDMIQQYGLLVKNHSLKAYSSLIQKVIARIEADLTVDQSLNTHATLLNVSPSYLSTLFRKETGITLTEYANRKRVEYGMLLLSTTQMQVQTIAQHCGISDINYFTRIFKKVIGKTPTEYRNSIGS